MLVSYKGESRELRITETNFVLVKNWLQTIHLQSFFFTSTTPLEQLPHFIVLWWLW